MNSFDKEVPLDDYAPLDGYEIDLFGVSVMIIASKGCTVFEGEIIPNNRVVPYSELEWRKGSNGYGVLTLAEISQQLKDVEMIYVIVESELSGEIFTYDETWQEHGTTKGYA